MSGWKAFAREYGAGTRSTTLAAVVGRPATEIDALRAAGGLRAGTGKPRTLDFVSLFMRYHGRAPNDEEWPAPERSRQGSYEWLQPEIALLTALVGLLGPNEIAIALTARLRGLTGDPSAGRTREAVLTRMHLCGLQSSDVLGGITVAVAARLLGTRSAIDHAVRNGRLNARRVGRSLVIDYAEWERWCSTYKEGPPEGYVRLAQYRGPLGFNGDKLSEMARLGYVPTAIRCSVQTGPSTQSGVWFIDPEVAKKLLDDRRQGLAMPWFGKPLLDNLKKTWKLLGERQHPIEGCADCRAIWGEQGAPESFDDYVERYPGLTKGQKRHLTRPWTPGLTIATVAAQVGRSDGLVRRAIASGMLRTSEFEGIVYVSQTDATRWRARGCPTGDGLNSWISFESANTTYGLSEKDLEKLIAAGEFEHRVGTDGAMRGIRYVPRQRCSDYRNLHGFSRAEAARRIGVPLDEIDSVLEGLEWRVADGVPLTVVHNAIKRIQSEAGHTLSECAEILGVGEDWISARIEDGEARLQRSKWRKGRVYLTEPTVEHLRKLLASGIAPAKRTWGNSWCLVGEGAILAGVSITTLGDWAKQCLVIREHSPAGFRYDRESIKSQARVFWQTSPWRRDTRVPQWLKDERSSAA